MFRVRQAGIGAALLLLGGGARAQADTDDRSCHDAGWAGSAHKVKEVVNRRIQPAEMLFARAGY